jgi:hypothetical protein
MYAFALEFRKETVAFSANETLWRYSVKTRHGAVAIVQRGHPRIAKIEIYSIRKGANHGNNHHGQ